MMQHPLLSPKNLAENMLFRAARNSTGAIKIALNLTVNVNLTGFSHTLAELTLI